MAYRSACRSKGYSFALQLVLSLGFVSCIDSEDHFEEATLRQPLRGTLTKVIVEGQGANSGSHYFLKLDESRRLLELTFETPPDALTGTTLDVEGSLSNSRFHVTRYVVVGSLPTGLRRTDLPLTSEPSIKYRAVGVITVDLNDAGVNVTNDELYRLILDPDNPGPLLGMYDTDKSTRQYYSEVAYSRYRLRGAVEGPFAWKGSACIGGLEDAAYVLRDQLSKTYANYMWYFGSVDEDCGYAWGEVGTWNNPARNSWFNGRFDATVFPHELGHNLGLMHASTLSCNDKPIADDPLTCTTEEYGNPYSVMGTGGIRHLNAVEKWYLSWFSGCSAVRVRHNGTFTLLPIEIPCNGIQALQIPMPKTTRTFVTEQSETPSPLKYYYLELRTNRGLDTGMVPEVLIHVSDDIQSPDKICARTALIDTKPTTSPLDGLKEGESFTDPSGDLTFSADIVNDDKALITVTMPNNEATTCVNGMVLAGSGPENCDEPYFVDNTGGAAGEDNPHSARGGTGNDGGTTASTDPTSSGNSTNGGGGHTAIQDNDNSTSRSGCRVGGPRTSVSRTVQWATLAALLLLAKRRR
jgi:hypothetical protein